MKFFVHFHSARDALGGLMIFSTAYLLTMLQAHTYVQMATRTMTAAQSDLLPWRLIAVKR